MAGGGSAGGNFILTAVAGWCGSVEISKDKEKWKVVVKYDQKMYNCNKCVLHIFSQMYILFCAVVSLFWQLY